MYKYIVTKKEIAHLAAPRIKYSFICGHIFSLFFFSYLYWNRKKKILRHPFLHTQTYTYIRVYKCIRTNTDTRKKMNRNSNPTMSVGLKPYGCSIVDCIQLLFEIFISKHRRRNNTDLVQQCIITKLSKITFCFSIIVVDDKRDI